MGEDGVAIGLDELSLATRNHGMPLEALALDRTPVGLHYVLVHYDIPFVDEGAWRLDLGGAVLRPLSLDLEAIRALPKTSHTVTMECAGNGRALYEERPVSQPWLLEAVGTAEWTGVPLRSVLEQAGVGEDATHIAFEGLDRGIEGGVEQSYERGLSIENALAPDVLLAYEMNGAPLPPQHGHPLRLVVPGWYGMASVKWLSRIAVLDHPFEGYQNRVSYRRRLNDDDPGQPLERMHVRSLMVPPGHPSFLPRSRHLAQGPATLQGRAWSGAGSITQVEVSDDGGNTWSSAQLEPSGSAHAWRAWSFAWDATPGDHELVSRATDDAGARQPITADWNTGGYANNAWQRIPVVVTSPD